MTLLNNNLRILKTKKNKNKKNLKKSTILLLFDIIIKHIKFNNFLINVSFSISL